MSGCLLDTQIPKWAHYFIYHFPVNVLQVNFFDTHFLFCPANLDTLFYLSFTCECFASEQLSWHILPGNMDILDPYLAGGDYCLEFTIIERSIPHLDKVCLINHNMKPCFKSQRDRPYVLPCKILHSHLNFVVNSNSSLFFLM